VNKEIEARCTLAATLLQRLLGVIEPELEDESQSVSITSTFVSEEVARTSLKEQLEQAIRSASIPATQPSNTSDLSTRTVQKECEV